MHFVVDASVLVVLPPNARKKGSYWMPQKSNCSSLTAKFEISAGFLRYTLTCM